MTLSPDELSRYSRHFNLPQFDIVAQEKLKNAKVLVVGAGGLGAPVLLYLAASGVGTLGIIDMDSVDITNLQRQILYDTSHIGISKVKKAKDRITAMNPHIAVNTYPFALTAENALEIIREYDLVVDGTDNFQTRYLVNDAVVLCDKVNVYASIFRFEGQVSVFNYRYEDNSHGPNYRDLYPTPPAPGVVPDCATGGVLGVLPGIVGSMQALEVIKLITGVGEPLIGKLLIYDALKGTTRILKYREKTAVKISGLINYDEFCGVTSSKSENMGSIKEITVQELKEWKDSNKDFQLIDVREQNEWDLVNIAGEHVPMGEIMHFTDSIATDKEVVVLCRTGKRSAAVISALQRRGFENLYNLKGGIKAWAQEIDTSLPTY
jgi:adenylyltransferase/sulfurtransferase